MNRRSALWGFGAVAGVLLGLALAWLAPRWGALSTFPWMPSSYEAKELCSCRFVERRDAAFCDAYVAQSVVPSQGHVVDEEGRRVTATALWLSSSARWVSDRDGCAIE